MGMTAAAYLEQLQALLPTGTAWPRDPAATLTRLLESWGDGLARLDGRTGQLLDEADPRMTAELLADWERVAGLPDACVAAEQTSAQRRAALYVRLTSLGGQTAAYYLALAASLSYTISVTEFTPHSVNDDVEHPLYGQPWAYAWQVGARQDSVGVLSVSDSAADPLAWWGNNALECVISRLKPAHTHVLFAYT